MSEIEVVRTALRHAAKSLDRRLQSFEEQGSLAAVRAHGAVSAQHLGSWDAARAFGITTDQAHKSLTAGYAKFLDEYQAAISALLQVADGYDDAEDMSVAKIRAIMSNIGE